MALSKVTYVDGVTIIGAKNLNDIQDELIRQGEQQTADEEATAAALALKADKSTTYTKTEVDSALALKADKSDTYTKAQVDASLALKADKSDTYTKAEVDASLELKADKTETYTKAQVDSIVEDAIAEAVKESEYSNFEMKSVSGDFIHITDGAGLIPVKDLKIGIEAVQEGTGDPSPENVRPITGWTGAKVSVNGVNQWDEEWELGSLNNSTGQPVSSSSIIRSKNFIRINPSTSYCKVSTAQAHINVYWYDINKNFISMSGGSGTGTYAVITSPDNAYYMKFRTDSAYGTTYKNDTSINYPSTETDYHAYDGSRYEVTWEDEAGTIYGGTLDVKNGKLVKTFAIQDLGALYYDQASTVYFQTAQISNIIKKPSSVNEVTEAICTSYRAVAWGASAVDGDFAVSINGRLSFRNSKIANADDFKASMEGQYLVYPLATPVEYDITAMTDIKTLLGENNIFADTGAVEELIYRISRQ